MFTRIKNLKIAVAFACAGTLGVFGWNIASIALPYSAASAAFIPPLMLPYGSGWSGGADRGNGADVPPEDFLPADFLNGPKYRQRALERGIPLDRVGLYLQLRSAGQQLIPPASGIGELIDDPQHPYISNSMERSRLGATTARIADLTDEAAKNLKPWALETVRKQNELALAGKAIETRFERCWQLGVPAIIEVRHPLYFIQTPSEVVMYQGEYVRHVYMNVPHSKNPKPSWNGESAGHYEGDTLVVDTIGENDKTFVDSYRTPHTSQIHVIERYRVIRSGRGLDTSFTVDDPGAFYKSWGARRPRYLVTNHPLDEADSVCAAGNEDVFHLGLDPLQKAVTPDF